MPKQGLILAIKMAIMFSLSSNPAHQGGKCTEDHYTIAEAKNRLPSIIHSVEKGPSVKLTRRGRTVAVLLSIAEYDRLNRKTGSFWSALQSLRNQVEIQRIEISDVDFDGLRDKTPGREVGWTQWTRLNTLKARRPCFWIQRQLFGLRVSA